MNKHCMSVASLRVGTPFGVRSTGSYLVGKFILIFQYFSCVFSFNEDVAKFWFTVLLFELSNL